MEWMGQGRGQWSEYLLGEGDLEREGGYGVGICLRGRGYEVFTCWGKSDMEWVF